MSSRGISVPSASNQKQISEKKLRVLSTPANKQIKETQSNGITVYDSQSTTIEVTVKTKDRMNSPAMVNGKSSAEKKRPSSTNRTPNNWGQIFREQSKPVLKGAVQQLSVRNPGIKTSRISSTDTKKLPEKRQSTKYSHQTDRHLDEIPSRLSASNQKSTDYIMSESVFPSSTTVSSAQRIIVIDKGVQCGGIFDSTNGSLSLFNPVSTLGFLMKELERRVKDEKSSKILTEMEQALLRIPPEPGKITPEYMQAIVMRNNLDAVITKLDAKSKEVEAMNKSLKKDNEKLVEQCREHAMHLEQSNRRETELECLVERLRSDLNKANLSLKSDTANRDNITELKEGIKQMEVIQRNLRADLNEQTQIAQQAMFEVQCLKLEREKINALSSFKDRQLVENRKAIRELQSLIHNQLMSLSKANSISDKGNSNPEVSTIICGGMASSSQLSSNNSENPLSWREGSQFSISTVNSKANPVEVPIEPTPANQRSVHTLDDVFNESGGEKFKEKTHLEFTSLAGEEVSRTTSAINREDDTIYKSLDEVDQVKRPSFMYNDPNIDKVLENIRLDLEVKKSQSKSKKNPENDNYQKSSREKDFQHFNGSNFQDVKILLENVRLKRQVDVKIPSPIRKFPEPDWPENSLPTMSVTESNNA